MKIVMYRLAMAMLSISSLIGCASLYKSDATTFELVRQEVDGSIFKYKSVADMYYPVNSTDAERARMVWLETWLRDNGYKTEHYQILSRVPIVKLKTQNELTSQYDIHYEVKASK